MDIFIHLILIDHVQIKFNFRSFYFIILNISSLHKILNFSKILLDSNLHKYFNKVISKEQSTELFLKNKQHLFHNHLV